MFEFTTLSVYNDIVTSGNKANLIVNNGKKPYIRIGNTRFDKKQIVSIDYKKPTNEYLAEVTFDLSKLTPKIDTDIETEITGRIALYITLSMNSQDSFYANDFVYKGKPFFIEFPYNEDTTAAEVKKIVDKYLLLMTDEKILDVTADGKNITFKGVNGYQLIKTAILQWFNPEAKSVDCCTNQGDYLNVVVGVPVMWEINQTEPQTDDAPEVGALVTQNLVYDGDTGRALSRDGSEVAILPGLEAFCDYSWIIHNLRLPTLANTHFWSPTKNEMPIPGAKYTLITITMRDTNKGTAGNDIGQVTTCQTTHVLYVIEDKADAVITAFTNLMAQTDEAAATIPNKVDNSTPFTNE